MIETRASAEKRSKSAWKGNLAALTFSILLGLVAIEGISRVLDKEPVALDELNLRPWPYMMMIGPNFRNPIWYNTETESNVPSRMEFNNLGFTNDRSFSFPPDQAYENAFAKKSGEKLVLITGGSAVHGVGATANDRTIAGQLEKVLNERQSSHKYRVLNLANAGWIAYQQFVGMALFGLPLDPDWIVTMDGHNDATVTCAHGSGPGNPIEWPKLLYLLGGGKDFARSGPELQWLLSNFAAARVVTGLRPDRQNTKHEQLFFDNRSEDKRFNIKMRDVTFDSLDRQVTFYLQSERSAKDIFARANVLFSTQPLLQRNQVSPWYRKAFRLDSGDANATNAKDRLRADLDSYMAKMSSKLCGETGLDSLGYFIARSALHLEQKTVEWATASPSRTLLYANVETLFPERYWERVPYFIDNVHTNDIGQRRIAEYFAGYILRADVGLPFDPARLASAVKSDAAKVSMFPSFLPPPKANGRPVANSYVTEGAKVSQIDSGVVRVDENENTGFHRVRWSDIPVPARQVTTVSVDVWFDAVVDVVRLEMKDAAGTTAWAIFDLAARNVAESQGTAGAYVENLGKGWRRLILRVHHKANSASLSLGLMSSDDVPSSKYTGQGRTFIITTPTLASQ
jgi:hypothetical protein